MSRSAVQLAQYFPARPQRKANERHTIDGHNDRTSAPVNASKGGTIPGRNIVGDGLESMCTSTMHCYGPNSQANAQPWVHATCPGWPRRLGRKLVGCAGKCDVPEEVVDWDTKRGVTNGGMN